MRHRIPPLVLALSLCVSGVAAAQVPQWVTQILNAAELPITTLAARTEGVPSADIQTALDAMLNRNVPAYEARDLIDEERTARREHGPVNNFGAFVQSKLDAGLRGRDLAAAIRAEHVAHGMGRGMGQGMGQTNAPGQGQGMGQGRPGMSGDMQKPGRGAGAPPPRGGKPPEGARGNGKKPSPGRPDKPNR